MSCCCCRPKITCCTYQRNVYDCPCCLNDDLNLVRLKNTNNELKSLINRIDQLSNSVETSLHTHRSKTACNCHDACNLCRTCREKNQKHSYVYNLTICDDCERMVRLNAELEKKKFRYDTNIYPLEKYPCGKQFYCDKCDKCVDAIIRRRSRSRSRSRNSSPCVTSRTVTPEPRPSWNGGPWVSYYPMTQLKLEDLKK